MKTQEFGMQGRIAAQALIEKVVVDYDARPERSLVARIFGMPPIPLDESSWHVGALGERIVAQALARLPEGWHTFNSIPIGTADADIDHVVVGPGGIFAINSKHHAGKRIWVAGRNLMVDGQRQHYVANSLAEAHRLTKVLKSNCVEVPDAAAVIAIVHPKQISFKEKPHEVTVLDAHGLRRWLLKRPPVMDAETISRVVSVFDDPDTWRATPEVDRDQLARRFDELMVQLRRAQTIHALWILGLAVGVFAACWLIVTQVLQLR